MWLLKRGGPLQCHVIEVTTWADLIAYPYVRLEYLDNSTIQGF